MCLEKKIMSLIICISFLIIFGVLWALFVDRISKISPKIYAALAAISFLICAIFGANDHDHIVFVVTFFFISMFLLAFCWISSEKRKQDKEEQKEVLLAKMVEEDNKKEYEKYEFELSSLSYNYGQITNEYDLSDELNINKRVLVFAESQKIWIIGKIYDFKDIIGCSVNDNSHVKKADVTYKTSTSTGSMIGRAVVGGVLTGGVGAVIGGATASKKTMAVPSGNDTVVHNYTVVININSFTTPVIYLKCYNDENLRDNLLGIFNVIIRQNTQQ